MGFAARGEPVYGTGSYEAVFCRILRAAAALDGIPAALYPMVAVALLRQPEQRPSACWLAREVARLDLDRPTSRPTSVTVTPVGRGGTARPPVAASPAPARRERDDQRPDEFAGLLPGVWRTSAPKAAPARRKPRPARAPRRYRLLSLAILGMAVGASLRLPVAAPLIVAGLLTLLRAGDRTRKGLAARRAARGPRARDPLLLIGSVPWMLTGSIIETSLLAPLLLAAAGLSVAGATIAAGTIAARGAHVLPALAAVAAAYTLLSWLGPRSRPARRELNRAFDVLASTPLTAALALLALAALANGLVFLILIKTPPPLWPVPGLHSVLNHVPGMKTSGLGG